MPAQFFNELILIIIAAFAGGYVARSARLPPMLGYIVSGIVFGAVGKNFFHSYDSLATLSQVGVSLLLFTLGFEIPLETFRKTNKKVFILGAAQVVATSLALFILLSLAHFDARGALLFSIVFSFSSTAVVMKILEERGALASFPGSDLFIYLLIQDLFVVPVIFLLPLLYSQSALFSPSHVATFLIASIRPLVIFISILLFSKLFLSRALGVLFRYPSHELSILGTIFIAAVSIGAFVQVGLPESLSAFLAGFLISEQGKNLAPLSEIRPFRDVFLVLFFVTSGMLLDVPYFLSHAVLLLFLTAAVLGIKFLSSYLVLLFTHYIPTAAAFISSYLANIGEFALVIGQIAFLSGYINRDTYNTLLSLFILSLLAIPLSVAFGKSISALLSKTPLAARLNTQPREDFDPPPLENHVIICGHGRLGEQVRDFLDSARIDSFVIDFNKRAVADLLAEDKQALYADPSDVDVLRSAHIVRAKALVITIPDFPTQRRIVRAALSIHPHVTIIARGRNEEESLHLIRHGVNVIVNPELEAGVKIGEEVLALFDISPETKSELGRKARKVQLL